MDELHSDICQDFIASVSDSDTADSDFEYFDSNADGVVSLKEFLDLADTLINVKTWSRCPAGLEAYVNLRQSSHNCYPPQTRVRKQLLNVQHSIFTASSVLAWSP